MTSGFVPLRAIALMLSALLLFALLDATVKHLAETFAVPLLVWARYTVHCTLMVLFLAPSMRARLFRSRRAGSQVARALMLVCTTGFGMAALRLMPLAETTALGFVAPLIVTLLAGPLLGERIGAIRWLAVLAGFAGVLLIARPGGMLGAIGVVLALCAAFSYSMYQILTRHLAATENPVTLLFCTAAVGTVVMSAALPWFWGGPMPSARQALLIASLGLYGGMGHFLLTHAFRHAPASMLSPFLYVQLIWATLLGWAVFGHLPDALAVIGMTIIAASGLMLALVERFRRRSH